MSRRRKRKPKRSVIVVKPKEQEDRLELYMESVRLITIGGTELADAIELDMKSDKELPQIPTDYLMKTAEILDRLYQETAEELVRRARRLGK